MEAKQYIVQVTEEDIKNGKVEDGNYCPIALAVCRALDVKPEDFIVEIDGNINIESETGYCIERVLPLFTQGEIPISSIDYRINEFVKQFDRGLKVEPFQFIMELGTYIPDGPDFYDDYDDD